MVLMKSFPAAALALLVALALPAAALADPAEVHVMERDRAAGQAWFQEHIAPTLGRSVMEEVQRSNDLYDPNEAKVPQPVSGDRKTWTYRMPADGRVAVVGQTGNLPATASEQVRNQDWSSMGNATESNRREMYRFYLDTGEAGDGR